jgi:toxin CptA
MHGIGVAGIWLLPLALWLKLLVGLAVAASLAFYGARDGWRVLGQSVVAVRLRSDCRCEIETRRGPWREARLLGSSYVSPYLSVLNLRLDGHVLARHVVILPDAVDGEGFRRLRVLLKWKCNASATDR